MNINEYDKYRLKVISLIVLLVMGTYPSYAVGQQSDGTTVTVKVDPLDQYRGKTELSQTELIDMLSLVGFEGKSLKTAWAIVMKESRGHPLSHNTSISSGDNSYGLFQINMLGSLGIDRREKFGIKTNEELLDPVKNAQAAFYMSAHGTDFASWGLGPNAYDGTPDEPGITMWLSKFPK